MQLAIFHDANALVGVALAIALHGSGAACELAWEGCCMLGSAALWNSRIAQRGHLGTCLPHSCIDQPLDSQHPPSCPVPDQGRSPSCAPAS